MDQKKIGAFIAERRKMMGLTQMTLAEKLSITDRAVSKWETGRSLPDASLMPLLCLELDITLSDLFAGEKVSMDNRKELEKAILDAVRQKQEADRKLLKLEIVIGLLSMVILFTCVFTAAFLEMTDIARVLLIVFGFVCFLIGVGYALKIEQEAGYYLCAKCGHRYVPTYNSVFWAMHFCRTRYMRCPNCGKWSWQKKVIEKE